LRKGSSSPSLRIALVACSPSIFGIMMSMNTHVARWPCRRTTSTASSPSEAISTLNPIRRRWAVSTRTLTVLSSTTIHIFWSLGKSSRFLFPLGVWSGELSQEDEGRWMGCRRGTSRGESRLAPESTLTLSSDGPRSKSHSDEVSSTGEHERNEEVHEEIER